MRKKTVRDLDVGGKRVLVRVDFNVPFDRKTHTILDDTRIRAALPTIEYLIGQGAYTILCSHLGRPDGKVVEDLRLGPVALHLAGLLKRDVTYCLEVVGPEVEEAIRLRRPGDVVMLENIRFSPGEEDNAPAFAKQLADLAEVYVNDAFGTAHRAHASTEGVARYLPAVAGFLMEKELEFLGRVVASPEHPMAVIIGGAKVSSKIGVLRNLLGKADRFLIGGGMANTFLAAQGKNVGASTVEQDVLATAREFLEQARQQGARVLLPIDAVVADRFAPDAATQTVDIDAVPEGWLVLDIGPKTASLYAQEIIDCATVLWNGPMGVFEMPAFAEGTHAVARAVADVQGTTVVGGGETVAAVAEQGLEDQIDHVSTGGGASLEYLEGQELPGVAALLE
ncbi:MAG: phosphoglycerate kinase [Chloroflexi bacterium]|nr:phosphoglycerate kinase [Chloroflexota bacterium]